MRFLRFRPYRRLTLQISLTAAHPPVTLPETHENSGHNQHSEVGIGIGIEIDR